MAHWFERIAQRAVDVTRILEPDRRQRGRISAFGQRLPPGGEVVIGLRFALLAADGQQGVELVGDVPPSTRHFRLQAAMRQPSGIRSKRHIGASYTPAKRTQ